MTHDIQDLLNLIKELEEKIIKLEKNLQDLLHPHSTCADNWYWDH